MTVSFSHLPFKFFLSFSYFLIGSSSWKGTVSILERILTHRSRVVHLTRNLLEKLCTWRIAMSLLLRLPLPLISSSFSENGTAPSYSFLSLRTFSSWNKWMEIGDRSGLNLGDDDGGENRGRKRQLRCWFLAIYLLLLRLPFCLVFLLSCLFLPHHLFLFHVFHSLIRATISALSILLLRRLFFLPSHSFLTF